MSKYSCLLLSLCFAFGCKTSSSVKPVSLELFVMSQCPYGVQVMNAVAPVAEKLGSSLEVSVNYIGTDNAGTLGSMHGDKEVKGDMVQLCAHKLAPKGFLKFVACQNKSWQQVDTNWRECAKDGGVDADDLQKCLEGETGKTLLAKSFAESTRRGAQGSPTIFLNSKAYEGGRRERDLLRAVCEQFSGTKPQACTSIPQAPKVAAIFFSDKRCPDCNIAPLEARLKNDLGGLTVTSVDYGSEQGKKLYADLKGADASFRFLPVILFDNSITQDHEGYQMLERYLRPLGSYRSLQLGGKFDPAAEICDNKTDDDGNGKSDCEDQGCKENLVCRTEKPKSLDLFVMSQCPYGAKAVTAMQEVLTAFPKDMALSVHFIGEERGSELTSMHGPAEVEEDVRQACAVKHYGKKHQFMSYLTCRAADYRSANWEICTGNNGIDAAVIKKCVESEGQDLLRAEFKLSNGLGINASPTFLANNKFIFNGIAAEAIKQSYCKHNGGLTGCDKALSGDQGDSAAGSCGK